MPTIATAWFWRCDEGRKATEPLPFFCGNHSSTSRWALMPPKPKALIAARRGTPFLRNGHGVVAPRRVKGLLSRSTPLAGVEKLAVGGKVWALRARRVLRRAAEPAAVRRWPIFDLT